MDNQIIAEASIDVNEAPRQAENAQQTADNATSGVTNLNDPNLMSVIEKQTAVSQFAGLTSQYNVILARAKDANISTTDLTTAYAILNTLMADILTDTTKASDIDRDTYNSLIYAYNTALSNVQNALKNSYNTDIDNMQSGVSVASQAASSAAIVASQASITGNNASHAASQAASAANEAKSAGNNATSVANNASQAASDAVIAGSTAAVNADKAVNVANEAKSAGDNATSVANNASQAASNAIVVGSTAAVNADKAINVASQAQIAGSNAVVVGNQASEAASNASVQASMAVSNANDANNNATSGITIARSAANDMAVVSEAVTALKGGSTLTLEQLENGLRTKISTSDADALVDTKTASLAETMVKSSDFASYKDQTAGAITQTVSKAIEDINNRNLALSTATPIITVGQNKANQCISIALSQGIPANQPVNVSFDIVSTTAVGSFYIQHAITHNIGSWEGMTPETTLTTALQHISATSTSTVDEANTVQLRFDNVTGTVTVTNIMVVMSSTEASWLPAPEDTQSEITQTIDNASIGFKNADGTSYSMNLSADGTALMDVSKLIINGQTSIMDATIGTAQIADAAITNAKIANLAVGTAQIANAAITDAQIGSLAVGTAQIKDAAINSAKIAELAVGTAQIGDGAITNAKIGKLAVGTAQIASGAITNAQIGSLAVGTAQIKDAAINSAKIAKLAVGTAQIGDGAITNAKIGKLAVGTAQIANAAITDAQIGNISANKLTAGTIDFNTITGKNINAANITTGKLDTDRLNVGKLSALSADLGDVTTGSLKGVDIVAKTFSTPNGSFTTDANGAITATNMTIKGGTINTPTLDLGMNGTFTEDFDYTQSTSLFLPKKNKGTLTFNHGVLQSRGNMQTYANGQWGGINDGLVFQSGINNAQWTEVAPGYIKLDLFKQNGTDVAERTYTDPTGYHYTDSTGVASYFGNVLSTPQVQTGGVLTPYIGPGNALRVQIAQNGKDSGLEVGSYAGKEAVLSDFIYNFTTSSSPNVYIYSNGHIMRTTSASKYKYNIKNPDIEDTLGDRLLNVHLATWNDKHAVDSYAEQLSTGEEREKSSIDKYYGLIAEQLRDAGLDMFIDYGKNHEIEGIKYDRAWVPLLSVIRRLNNKVNEYELRLSKLEGKINE